MIIWIVKKNQTITGHEYVEWTITNVVCRFERASHPNQSNLGPQEQCLLRYLINVSSPYFNRLNDMHLWINLFNIYIIYLFYIAKKIILPYKCGYLWFSKKPVTTELFGTLAIGCADLLSYLSKLNCSLRYYDFPSSSPK